MKRLRNTGAAIVALLAAWGAQAQEAEREPRAGSAASAFLASIGAPNPEFSVVAHGLSKHMRARPQPNACGCAGYQQLNLGAGLRAQWNPAWAWQAGVYRNSVDETSAYLLADWTPLRAGPFSAGLFGGAASGYHEGGKADNPKKLRGAAGALARIDLPKSFGRAAIGARLIPDARLQRLNIVEIEASFGF